MLAEGAGVGGRTRNRRRLLRAAACCDVLRVMLGQRAQERGGGEAVCDDNTKQGVQRSKRVMGDLQDRGQGTGKAGYWQGRGLARQKTGKAEDRQGRRLPRQRTGKAEDWQGREQAKSQLVTPE